MSFIAAILLLNMEVADAFVCFANLLNRPCQVSFFRMDEEMVRKLYVAFCIVSVYSHNAMDLPEILFHVSDSLNFSELI